jgi:hypothetical protein
VEQEDVGVDHGKSRFGAGRRAHALSRISLHSLRAMRVLTSLSETSIRAQLFEIELTSLVLRLKTYLTSLLPPKSGVMRLHRYRRGPEIGK